MSFNVTATFNNSGKISVTTTHTLTGCLVALVQSLLVEVQGKQEVGVPSDFLVVRHLVALPRCQGGVQEGCCSLGTARPNLYLVLQLIERANEMQISWD